jgi:hypothetical protein
MKLSTMSLLAVLCGVALTLGLSIEVYAWKPYTHVFAANEALTDALDGELEIPPLGKFKVPQKILDAIKKFPEAYRAGVVGPDAFPDFLFG